MLRETTSRGLGPVRNPVMMMMSFLSLTQGGDLFSLVPLVWESSPKLQGVWCKPNHQPIGGCGPNHQGIWSPPRAGLCCSLNVCVYYCSTYYKAVRVGEGGEGGGHVLRETTSRGLCGLVCPSLVNAGERDIV